MGRRRLPCVLVLSVVEGADVFDFDLIDLEAAAGVGFEWRGLVLYGGLGILSGLSR